MPEKTIPERLTELLDLVSTKKKGKIEKDTELSLAQFNNDLDLLQDLCDNLRLKIVYMLFDLETTRRENSFLRQALKDKGKEKT